MRILTLIAVALVACCSALPPKPTVVNSTVSAALPVASNLLMMDSTVQVHVTLAQTLIQEPDEDEVDAGVTKPKETPEMGGWTGSGVVAGKVTDPDGKTRSLIISANHVLETPAIGSIEPLKLEFLGMELDLGSIRTDAVVMTITTEDGRSCELKPLKLGSSDEHDVATAVAMCDAGRVAKIATSSPIKGEKVTVLGHPHGVDVTMITEGYVAGYDHGYLLSSAPVAGGNSGGPMFYNGEVVGIVVRVDRSYPHISLAIPADEIQRRLAETPAY
jgi:S1-C subfamily serine protease